MKIRYFGHACFKLTDSTGFSVFTDPFSGIGYELPSGLSSNVVTVSHGHFDHNNVGAIAGAPKILQSHGTFELEDVTITGIKSYHDEKEGALRGENVIFKFHMDGLEVCHLGDLGEKCSTELIEKLLPINILLIPVGGKYTIDSKEAKEYVDKIKPNIVIPMHYKTKNSIIDIENVQAFLDEFNEADVTISYKDELEFSIKDVIENKTKIILMESAQ